MAIHRFSTLPDSASITEDEAEIIAAACPAGGLILETGTYKGLGTERIAKYMPKDARLLTLEAFDDLAEQARERLKDDPRVTVITADSSEYQHRGQLVDVLVLDCFDRRAALENLKQLANPGCVVFVHDLDKPGPSFEFRDSEVELLGTCNGMARVN
jgi:predicted O-methyltransferase YrrM